jgi:hypothetical protein
VKEANLQHLTPDRSLKSLQERVEALASRHQGLLC